MQYEKELNTLDKISIRESDELNSMIDAMLDSEKYSEDPEVGIFWYDTKKDELFGIYKQMVSDLGFYHSKFFKADVKTCKRLHRDLWRKEQFRHKDFRFNGDHTQTPRGRVFQMGDGSFKICVGDWIEKYPQVIDEIIFEFDLPRDKVEVIKDRHWDLGHGFSDELL